MVKNFPRAYKVYRWIVQDPDLLGGKLAVRGTRLSVAFVLGCLPEGMTLEEIADTYVPVPREALAEVFDVAAKSLDSSDVAA